MIKDAMEKNEKATPNGADLEVLKKHFRMCFNSDGSLDLEKLKARLGDQVAISNEGYELKFLGKNYARLLTSLETTTVVVPDKEHNAKPENAKSKNVYISGDNLDALKHLLKSKQGQVKCIYIDPPYNTGSDGFVYNDSFGFKVEELANKLSISEDEAQRILDFTKRGSASHSAWLMFMYPRLMLARELLAKDGVIFISIDDNEQANLKLMCDDVFSENCFLGTFLWKKRQNVDSRTKTGVSSDHDYLLCYGRSAESRIQGKESDKTKYSNPDNDPRGDWMSDNMVGLATAEQRPNLHYVLEDPKTGLKYACPETGWRYEPKRMAELIANGEVIFPKDKNGRPRRKKFLKDVESEYTGFSSFLSTVFSAQGTRELRELFDDVEVFDFPKPVDYIKLILQQGAPNDALVLDFFSGSATTAHAVMQLNAEDGGNRQFILVQLPEKCPEKSAAFTAGYKTIDEIGQARIKRAAAKIVEENPLLAKTMDLGFKHYTLKEVEGKTLDKIEKFDLNDNALAATDDILKEFGVETVLATWLVHDGYGFSAEPKVIDLDGYKAYWMEKHVYLIEPGLSDKGISALFDKFETEGSFNPGNVVVFGYSFSWTQLEALKNNLLKIAANGTNKHVLLDKRY